jgi:hypothetical protein
MAVVAAGPGTGEYTGPYIKITRNFLDSDMAEKKDII